MLLMPWGYSYGRLNSAAAIDMLKHATRGEMFLPGNRGRGCFDAPGQVAELVVADRVISAEGSLDVGTLRVDAELNEPGDVDGMAADEMVVRRVAHSDGRVWRVQLNNALWRALWRHAGMLPNRAARGWLWMYNRWRTSSSLAAHDFFGQEIAQKLRHLNNEDDHDGAGKCNCRIECVVAVGNGKVAKSATADVARHGGHINHSNEDEREAQNQGTERFTNDH